MFWNELDTNTKARLIRDGLRMGMKRWERVRDAYNAAEERRLAAGPAGLQRQIADELMENAKVREAYQALRESLESIKRKRAEEEKRAALRAANPEAAAWQDALLERIANHELPNAFELKVIGEIDRRGANTNFIQRARDPYRQTIPDWEGKGDVATHKMGWATDDLGAYIYPTVQQTDSGLVDYSNPAVNRGDRWMASDRAMETGDYVRATPLEAKVFTESYKKFYPAFEKEDSFNADRYEDFSKKYEGNNWTNDMFLNFEKEYKSSGLPFNLDDVVLLIADESRFNKFNKRSGNGVVGPMQQLKQNFIDIYGENGDTIYKQYIDNKREDSLITKDIINYLKWLDGRIKNERDKMTYGRLKVNQYAPNSSLDSKVSKEVWTNNIVNEINIGRLDKNLKFGETTYRDLMESYDRNKRSVL